MSNETKKTLDQVLKSYAAKNEMAKALKRDIADLGVEIKSMMTDVGLESYEVAGIKAALTYRTTKKLNLAKVEQLLGRAIPADCYDLVDSTVLNVKA